MLPLPSPPSTLLLTTEAVQCNDDEHILVEPISRLLASELDHRPLPNRTLDPKARQEAITWMLKVHEFYHFRPVTVCLAVNYFDRYLSSNNIPASGRWAWQLLSVACLSVAAKLEETHVPLLLDLQVMDPSFVFEPRIVMRMELFLMVALRWRLRPVTPFDFLYHFAGGLSGDVVSRATSLILDAQRAVGFVMFRPSAICAAAILCAAGEIGDCYAEDDVDFLCFHDLVNKRSLDGCIQLMEEYVVDTCRTGTGWIELKLPESPVGVLDAAACGSCDSEKSVEVQVHEAKGDKPIGADDKPPPFKRRRFGSIRCTETIDTIDLDDG